MKRSFAVAVAAAAFALAGMSGCAARTKTSYFERWSKQDIQRRAEMEKEEKIRAEVSARMGGESVAATPGGPKAAPTAAPAAPAAPPAPPTDDYSSLPAGSTPPVATSTPTRAITPTEDEDDAIY